MEFEEDVQRYWGQASIGWGVALLIDGITESLLHFEFKYDFYRIFPCGPTRCQVSGSVNGE